MLKKDPGSLGKDLQKLVAEESVIHLEDLFLRRTDWGFNPLTARAIVKPIADLLPWDAQYAESEVTSLISALEKTSERFDSAGQPT